MTTTTDAAPLTTGPLLPDGPGRIDDVVAALAARHPDRPAVRRGEETVGYGRLLAEADRVAAALTAAGVRPGDVVGVRVAVTPKLVSVLLGVLRAGAAYTGLPLDWPARRVADVLRRTGAVLCVEDAGHPFPVPDAPTADLDELLAGYSPARAVRGDGHAPVPPEVFCVIFTSGSTGTPKAVLSPHAGLLRVAGDPRLRFRPGACMLQTAPVGWDAFAMEVWCPLVSGGTTLIGDTGHLTPDDLRQAVRRGVDTLFLTTALFHVTYDEAPDVFGGLTTLMVGGERVDAPRLVGVRRRHPELVVLHVYGPVECTVYATAEEVLPDTPDDRHLPIGTPIAETGLAVVDDDLRPVPTGVTGELVLSGAGLAAGYLGQGDGRDGPFPLLPLGPGGAPVRVYRTGDLARVGRTGSVEFLGRRDRQVKIRGVRIDLNEIETLVGALPGVREAAVLALPHGAPNKEGLAAFYATAGEDGPAEADVRDAVAAALPSAFVPGTVLRVPALPRLANTKVDPAALAGLATASRQPAAAAEDVDDADLPPRLLAVLTGARELLGDQVPADADLFSLGATSITAIRLANRLSGTLGVKVPVAAILKHRTPRAIEAALAPAPAG
jgi:amino acid adenylation domain-containing protein